jgi:hypothetical protein
MRQQTSARVRSVPGFSRLSYQDAMPVCPACRFMRDPRLPHRTWTAALCELFRSYLVSKTMRYGTADFPSASLKFPNFCEFSQIT